MDEEKVRFGGMALANGVLVHGPSSWACAVRLPNGELRIASDYKRFRAADVDRPLLRGPARLLEAFSLLPELKRKLPEARLPFQRPAVMAAMGASAAAVALRGSELSAYHGAEHVTIGSYEHGEQRGKEHERCGSHLVGPLLVTTAIGNILAARAP